MRGMRPRLGRGGPSPPASWQGALASLGEALKPKGAGRNKIRLDDYGVWLYSTLHSERDKDPLVTRTGWTEKEEEEENIGGRPGRRVEGVTPRSWWRVSPFACSPSPSTAARRTECGPSSLLRTRVVDVQEHAAGRQKHELSSRRQRPPSFDSFAAQSPARLLSVACRPTPPVHPNGLQSTIAERNLSHSPLAPRWAHSPSGLPPLGFLDLLRLLHILLTPRVAFPSASSAS
jgi:hypothetical protein